MGIKWCIGIDTQDKEDMAYSGRKTVGKVSCYHSFGFRKAKLHICMHPNSEILMVPADCYFQDEHLLHQRIIYSRTGVPAE